MNSQPDSTHPFADWSPIPDRWEESEMSSLRARFPEVVENLQQIDLNKLRIRKHKSGFQIGRIEGDTVIPRLDSREEKLELSGALQAFRERLAEKKARLYLLAGFGAGIITRALVREIGLRNYPLLILEPDADLFRASLTLGDYSELFQNGRVFLATGEHCLEQAETILRRFHLYTESELCLIFRSSRLSGEEKTRYNHLLNQLAARKLGIEQEMNRRVVSFLQKNRSGKPDRIRKLWLCEHSATSAPHTRAQWHVARRLGMDLQEMGLAVVRPEFEPGSYHPSFYPVHSLMEADPDAALILNAFSTQTAMLGKAFSEKYPIPKISWFLDSPVVLAEQVVRFGLAPGDLLISADSRWFEEIADVSPEIAQATIHHLQAAATFRELGPEDDSWGCPVSYVGQVRPASDWKQLKKIDPAFAPVGEKIIREMADGARFRLPEMAQQVARAFPNAQRETILPILRRYYNTLVWEATSRRRVQMLQAAADQGLQVFGNPSWADRARSTPLNECLTGKTMDFEDLPRLYRNSAINLNFHHLQCSDCLNIRVFDVPASGGFLLTEFLPGLEQSFEIGVEIETFHSPSELVDKIDFYLHHPEKRREIAENGRRRVLRDHTYRHRWETMHSLALGKES